MGQQEKYRSTAVTKWICSQEMPALNLGRDLTYSDGESFVVLLSSYRKIPCWKIKYAHDRLIDFVLWSVN